MPLIIITGYPCSGKTHRALQIASDLTTRIDEYNSRNNSKRPLSVQHIPSRHTSLSNTSTAREEIYTSASAEKTARAAEFSAIKRALNNETVVIADSGNYIKGYRYQLWCEAKAVGTRCCVVHVAARDDEVEAWNRGREEEQQQGKKANGAVEENVKATTNKKGGVKGDTVVEKPESHTFLYGDRRNLHEDVEEDGLPDILKAKRKQHKQNGELESDLKSLFLDPRIPEATIPSQEDQQGIDTSSEPTSLQTEPAISATKPGSSPPQFPPHSPPYTPSTLHDLISRYEPPSPFTRWDTPLFTIPSTDADPPYTETWTALFPHLPQPTSPPPPNTLTAPSSNLSHPSPPTTTTTPSITSTLTTTTRRPLSARPIPSTIKPHAATVLPPSTSAQALQNLERGTNNVIKHILSHAATHTLSGIVGDSDIELSIPLPHPTTNQPQKHPDSDDDTDEDEDESGAVRVLIPAGTTLSLPHLQRLRRRYVQIERSAAAGRSGGAGGTGTARTGDENAVVRGFARWIGCEFGS